jgi:hypothetical protein
MSYQAAGLRLGGNYASAYRTGAAASVSNSIKDRVYKLLSFSHLASENDYRVSSQNVGKLTE